MARDRGGSEVRRGSCEAEASQNARAARDGGGGEGGGVCRGCGRGRSLAERGSGRGRGRSRGGPGSCEAGASQNARVARDGGGVEVGRVPAKQERPRTRRRDPEAPGGPAIRTSVVGWS